MADLSQETLRAAVLGALRDVIDGEYGHARGQVLDSLLEARRAGIPLKSVDVNLPDGQKVAQITLVDPSAETVVTDRQAFTAWVRKRAPEMVAQDESPLDRVARVIRGRFDGPVDTAGRQAHADKWAADAALAVLAELGIDPDPPEPRVSRTYETALLAALEPVKRDPEDEDLAETELLDLVEPESGEIVPGVEYRPAGEPTKFQMLYKPSSGAGRDAIARAWREGRLPSIEGLPEVGS